MGLHLEEFPLTVGYGTEDGFAWKTSIHELDSGATQRIGRWAIFRKQYSVDLNNRSLSQLSLLRHHISGRRGALHTFPVKDYSDYTTGTDDTGAPSDEDVVLGSGDGIETDFQLRKRYGDDTSGVYWTIKLPVSGSVVVALDGVAQTESSDFTVDYTTGIISFAVAPGTGIAVTAGCEFRVPCNYTRAVDELFSFSHKDFNLGEITEIGLIEDLNPSQVTDEYDYGGAIEVAISSGIYTPDFLHRMLTVSDATGDIKLPVLATSLGEGGPYLTIKNDDASNTLDIFDDDSNSVGSISTTSQKQLWIMISGGNREWLLV